MAELNEKIPEPDVVISCPGCIRQYRIKASTGGKPVQCGICCRRFVAAIPRAAPGDETPLVLNDPLTVRVSFLREGCDRMTRNTIEMLRLADEPVTREAIAGIARTIPFEPRDLGDEVWRRGLCNRVLEKACDRCLGTADQTRSRELFQYFVVYIPQRHFDALDMMVSAVAGVLENLELGEPELKAEPSKRRWPLWR